MNKIVMLLASMTVLSGCIGGSNGQMKMASKANVGMWTNRPAVDVVQCIAAQTGGTINRSLIVLPGGVRYEVGPALGDSTYPTQVSRFGPQQSSDAEKKVISCILEAKPAARS